MGKIYGVHDSYCALVSPSNSGPGDPKVCTCDSGKKSRKIFDNLKDEADWLMQAEKYADDLLSKVMESYEGFWPGPDQVAKMREVMIAAWKKGHPRASEPAPTPPPAAPGADDGPGEEDGPWAEGWGQRAGVPGHAEWFAANKHMLEALGWRDIRRAWCEYQFRNLGGKDGAALNATTHPFAAKSDAGKPKPYMYFVRQFPLGFKAVALHMERGCQDPGHVFLGWQNVEDGLRRYTEALLRHLSEHCPEPTEEDVEDGIADPILGVAIRQAEAVAANAMIRLELLLRQREKLNLDMSRSA